MFHGTFFYGGGCGAVKKPFLFIQVAGGGAFAAAVALLSIAADRHENRSPISSFNLDCPYFDRLM